MKADIAEAKSKTNLSKDRDVSTILARYSRTSLIRKRNPLGPYRRPMPRVIGGWAFFYGRGAPAMPEPETRILGHSPLEGP